MALDADKPLPLQLYTDNDNAETIAVKSRLESLVTGDITPTRAALDFDSWVVNEAERRLEVFKGRNGQARYDPTPEEVARGIDNVRSIGPNPEGHINDISEGIAKLSSSFPPFHPSQDLIIEFLEALRGLPQHEAPNVTPIWRLYDGNTGELKIPDHPGWDIMKLWAFDDPESDLATLVKDRFREEAESKFY